MKRIVPLLICLMLLCGCSDQNTVQEVNIQGHNFTVDTQSQTLDDGIYQYSYEISDDDVRIVYPDGAWYCASIETASFSSWAQDARWSEDYASSGFSKYADGQYLARAAVIAIEATGAERVPAIDIVVGIVLIALGILLVLFPGFGWKLRYSVWIKDAEPTDFALGVYRVVGGILIFAGFGTFFMW